ncbi:response regulator transcription factor [Nocardioides renjunii]|uniref:response regulator transcription factor n=1 Tax=Nocardioides renjunii TaxID=3095075 RepID=UPI002AFE27A9|nr:response regulator transcription factor [Nocardioides sp. S-34]WQQ22764.1 response regulator transcription factor [Nocardioides sp. S-34]
MPHVLVVEDDEDVAVPLASLLTTAGFDATVVGRGRDAIAHVGDTDTDMVILDLMLPDMDGIEVCGVLRDGGFDGGLIMVTARGGEGDVVAGLDAGADDYLAKPCSVAELQSRVRSVLRRIHRSYDEPAADAPPARSLEVAEHQITFAGREIVNAGREYDVLALLVAHHGRVVTRAALMDEVWGSDWPGSPMVLPTAIGRIRERLGAAGAPDRVENVRGIGYRLSAD